MMAGQAFALNVFDDGTNSLSIGGRIGVQTENKDGHTTANNDSARINFKFAHQFDNGWTGHGVAEWGFRAQDEYSNGEKLDTFFNRLGYVALTHDQAGDITMGKNWSVMYDVSGWTDAFAIGGGAALGIYDGMSSGDFDGTARADDTIQYRNSFGGLNVGAQYQLEDSDTSGVNRDKGYGVSASYDFAMGLSVGATYSETQYDNTGLYASQDKSKSATAGIKYQGETVYLAAMYGELRNKTELGGTLNAESKGYEAYGRVALPQVIEGFSVQAGYNFSETDDSGNDATLEKTMVGALYETGPMQFAVEYTLDDSKDINGKSEADDYLTLQARYYF